MPLKEITQAASDLFDRSKSEDSELREEAAWELGRQPTSEAIEQLINLLGDESRNVCYAAMRSLVGIGGREVTRRLLVLLRSEDVELRNLAVEIIARIGPDTLPEISPLLADSDQDVRKFVVDILSMIKGVGSEELLIQSLFDDNINVALTAAEALGKVGTQKAVPYLADCLVREAWLKCAVLKSLGRIGGKKAMTAVMSIGKKEEQIVLYTAVSALGEIADISGMDYLVGLFASDNAALEPSIIQAMEKIINRSYTVSLKKIEKKILPAKIIPLLNHDNKEVKRSAIALTGLLRTETAVPDLCRLFKEANADLFLELNEALIRIRPKNIAPLLDILASKDDSESVKIAAIRLVGQLDIEGSFELLSPWLDMAADELREEIIGALAKLSGRPDTFFFAQLGDRSAAIRKIAAAALANCSDPACIPQLMQLAADPVAEVRFVAARSLSNQELAGHKDQFSAMLNSVDERERVFGLQMMPDNITGGYSDEIVRLCHDSHGLVRAAAVTKSARLPPQEWRACLETALADSDEKVRLAAVRAIESRADSEAENRLLAIADADDVEWNRYEAVQALGRLGLSNEIAAKLVLLFAAAPELVQAAILDVLGASGLADGPALAKEAAGSEHELVREAASQVLASATAVKSEGKDA